jgi:hypothetical protein
VSFTYGPYPDGQSATGSNGPLEADGTVSLQPGETASYPVTFFAFFAIPSYKEFTGTGLQTLSGTGSFNIPIAVTSAPIAGLQENGDLAVVDYSASFYFSTTPGLVYFYTPASSDAPEPTSVALGACGLFFVIARKLRKSR